MRVCQLGLAVLFQIFGGDGGGCLVVEDEVDVYEVVPLCFRYMLLAPEAASSEVARSTTRFSRFGDDSRVGRGQSEWSSG